MAHDADNIELISGNAVVRNWDWWNWFLQREYYGSASERDGWSAAARAVAHDTALLVGSHVLDLGSGCGEMAFALAGFGAKVTGIESSRLLVEYCNSRSRQCGLDAHFVHADMFEWSADTRYDLILSVNTSFGYGSDQQNLALIDSIAHWLRPGGQLYLDMVSADHAQAFGAWNDELSGGRLIVDNAWDAMTGTMTSDPIWISAGKKIYTADRPEIVRIYSRQIIEDRFRRNGLLYRRLRNGLSRGTSQDSRSMMTTWIACRAATL